LISQPLRLHNEERIYGKILVLDSGKATNPRKALQ
jgi:hypothetical protein